VPHPPAHLSSFFFRHPSEHPVLRIGGQGVVEALGAHRTGATNCLGHVGLGLGPGPMPDGEKQFCWQVFTCRLYPPCEPSAVVGKLGSFWPLPPNLQLGSGCGMEQLPTSEISDGRWPHTHCNSPSADRLQRLHSDHTHCSPPQNRARADLHVRAGIDDCLAIAASRRGPGSPRWGGHFAKKVLC
jgi:hypothetical protein